VLDWKKPQKEIRNEKGDLAEGFLGGGRGLWESLGAVEKGNRVTRAWVGEEKRSGENAWENWDREKSKDRKKRKKTPFREDVLTSGGETGRGDYKAHFGG